MNNANLFSGIALALGVVGIVVSRFIPEGIILAMLGLVLVGVAVYYLWQSPSLPSLILCIVAGIVCGLPLAPFLSAMVPASVITSLKRWYGLR